MKILFVLISVSILVAGAFLTLFLWAVKSGQFDDTETPSFRMLFDPKKKNSQPEENHDKA